VAPDAVGPPARGEVPLIAGRDLALVLLVVLAWGSNFSAMKIALEELPPLLFVGLRFAILVPLIRCFPGPRAG
jgi:O-acetylserine/cysteine efflux transporter